MNPSRCPYRWVYVLFVHALCVLRFVYPFLIFLSFLSQPLALELHIYPIFMIYLFSALLHPHSLYSTHIPDMCVLQEHYLCVSSLFYVCFLFLERIVCLHKLGRNGGPFWNWHNKWQRAETPWICQCPQTDSCQYSAPTQTIKDSNLALSWRHNPQPNRLHPYPPAVQVKH